MSEPDRDYFVSYNSADLSWAEWIAWQLEAAGNTCVLQAWDFRPGSNFVVEMDRAAKRGGRTIAVLSDDYLGASFPQPEWAAAFAHDPEGLERTLIPVRIRKCRPMGLLGQIVYIDLVGLDEEVARERLLAGLQERGKPQRAPAFPGQAADEAKPPAFPGDTATAHTALTRAATWVKLNEFAFTVDELDDSGSSMRLKARLDEHVSRRLEALRPSAYGSSSVRVTYGNRVVAGQIASLRTSTRHGVTETEIELHRVDAVRGDGLRMGTNGLSADDLAEVGMRQVLLGEPLPNALGSLTMLADPGLNLRALAEAFQRPDPEAEQVIRLLLVDALIGHGNASAITRFELGPREGGARRLLLEWETPKAYTNVEPERRLIHGVWHSAGA